MINELKLKLAERRRAIGEQVTDEAEDVHECVKPTQQQQQRHVKSRHAERTLQNPGRVTVETIRSHSIDEAASSHVTHAGERPLLQAAETPDGACTSGVRQQPLEQKVCPKPGSRGGETTVRALQKQLATALAERDGANSQNQRLHDDLRRCRAENVALRRELQELRASQQEGACVQNLRCAVACQAVGGQLTEGTDQATQTAYLEENACRSRGIARETQTCLQEDDNQEVEEKGRCRKSFDAEPSSPRAAYCGAAASAAVAIAPLPPKRPTSNAMQLPCTMLPGTSETLALPVVAVSAQGEQAIPQERIQQRTVEEAVEVSVLQGEVVHVSKAIPQERIVEQMTEQAVEVLVPPLQEEIVYVPGACQQMCQHHAEAELIVDVRAPDEHEEIVQVPIVIQQETSWTAKSPCPPGADERPFVRDRRRVRGPQEFVALVATVRQLRTER